MSHSHFRNPNPFFGAPKQKTRHPSSYPHPPTAQPNPESELEPTQSIAEDANMQQHRNTEQQVGDRPPLPPRSSNDHALFGKNSLGRPRYDDVITMREALIGDMYAKYERGGRGGDMIEVSSRVDVSSETSERTGRGGVQPACSISAGPTSSSLPPPSDLGPLDEMGLSSTAPPSLHALDTRYPTCEELEAARRVDPNDTSESYLAKKTVDSMDLQRTDTVANHHSTHATQFTIDTGIENSTEARTSERAGLGSEREDKDKNKTRAKQAVNPSRSMRERINALSHSLRGKFGNKWRE